MGVDELRLVHAPSRGPASRTPFIRRPSARMSALAPKKERRRRLGLLLAAGVMAAVAALAVVGPPAALRPGWRAGTSAMLRGIGEFSVVNDSLLAADYALILNGKMSPRASLAAEVYHRGLAPRILIAETTEPVRGRPGAAPHYLHQEFAESLQQLGVPRSAIEFLPFSGGVTNTRDEARALRRFLVKHPAKRVIVVTTDYHTARARLILRQELNGTPVELLMAPASDTNGVNAGNWWRTALGRQIYRTEYLKLACALVRCS
jgi:uncharacterized SAM-binding protein YcdF (DUF218 family)